MTPWKPTPEHLFFKKNDPNDIRLGELVKSNSEAEKNCLLGYLDDEGIKLNGGRFGAAQAPLAIRSFLYRMTWPLPSESFSLSDLGSLDSKEPLEKRHEQATTRVLDLLSKGKHVVTFGGGHDYGFADGDAFVSHSLKASTHKPLVLNFDAHLDVRPHDKGLNSGTPFYRLLNKYSDKIEFIEIGIQDQCNSQHHWNWVKEKGGKIISLSDIRKTHLLSQVKSHISGTPPDQLCFVSFDIDVMANTLAPGCSQSWDSGLNFEEVREIILWILQNKRVVLFSIYEVSPPLDIDHRTSKLAALLTHLYLTEISR